LTLEFHRCKNPYLPLSGVADGVPEGRPPPAANLTGRLGVDPQSPGEVTYEREVAREPVHLKVFTDDPRLAALCTEYWQMKEDGSFRHPVKALAARFDVSPSRVSQTVAMASEARTALASCPSCGQGFVVRSRQQLLELQRSAFGRSRECEGCRQAAEGARKEARKQLVLERQLFLEDRYAIVDEHPISLDELTLEEAASLLALIRAPEHFSTDAVPPVARRGDVFAPTVDFGIELVRSLFCRELIRIHPRSELEAFVWEEEETSRFYPDMAA
jgi:hypothetical protein